VSKLSELRHILSGQFDSIGVSDFNISWASKSVSVNYQIRGGNPERNDFTIEKQRELGLRGRFRRSKRGR
jgi:hypothetical protein